MLCGAETSPGKLDHASSAVLLVLWPALSPVTCDLELQDGLCSTQREIDPIGAQDQRIGIINCRGCPGDESECAGHIDQVDGQCIGHSEVESIRCADAGMADAQRECDRVAI